MSSNDENALLGMREMNNLRVPAYQYVYAVIKDWDGKPLGQTLEDRADPHSQLHMVSFRDLSAATSPISLHELGFEDRQAPGLDSRWMENRITIHRTVVSHLQQNYSALPMALGTLCQSEAKVLEMLVRYYDRCLEGIERLRGKEEWELEVLRDRPVMETRLRKLRGAASTSWAVLATTAPVTTRSLGRLMDTLVASTAERVYASHCFQRLRQCAEDVSLPEEESPLHQSNGAQSVLRAVLLLSPKQREVLQRTAGDLQQEYAVFGIQLRIQGPFPPFHFNGLPDAL